MAETGTLLNDVSVGIVLSVSNEAHNFFPRRIYSQEKQTKVFHLYIQLIPDARFVAENSILQGGFFGKKQYYHIQAKDIERIMLQNTLVLGIRFRRVFIEYKQVYDTREFKAVHPHTYGSIGITVKI